jgi:hypothetical protein
LFLARKITRAKWLQRPELAQGEIAADAVTEDLRTNGNALSFWRCDTGAEDQVEAVALAMAASGDRIDKLDVVWIAERHFAEDGQTWEATEGRTPVAELRRRHVDLQRLDYVRLGNVARHVAAAIESERYLRLSRRRVRMLLVAAVRRGDVELGDLAESSPRRGRQRSSHRLTAPVSSPGGASERV